MAASQAPSPQVCTHLPPSQVSPLRQVWFAQHGSPWSPHAAHRPFAQRLEALQAQSAAQVEQVSPELLSQAPLPHARAQWPLLHSSPVPHTPWPQQSSPAAAPHAWQAPATQVCCIGQPQSAGQVVQVSPRALSQTPLPQVFAGVQVPWLPHMKPLLQRFPSQQTAPPPPQARQASAWQCFPAPQPQSTAQVVQVSPREASQTPSPQGFAQVPIEPQTSPLPQLCPAQQRLPTPPQFWQVLAGPQTVPVAQAQSSTQVVQLSPPTASQVPSPQGATQVPPRHSSPRRHWLFAQQGLCAMPQPTQAWVASQIVLPAQPQSAAQVVQFSPREASQTPSPQALTHWLPEQS
jgi:hypothetical protein